MLECFGVFSKVIALICKGSQCAAPTTLLPSRRRSSVGLALARAKDVGEASIAQFAPPAPRKGIAEQAKPVDCGEPVSCELVDPPRYWNPRQVHNRAKAQTEPKISSPHAEFVCANRLFASLVLRQVRRRGSVMGAEQVIGSSPRRSRGGVLVAASDSGSQWESAPPATMAAAASAPLTASIETLFTELAQSRLRSLAAVKSLR
jgi:hypothetical protein